jgi:hypothetical protein
MPISIPFRYLIKNELVFVLRIISDFPCIHQIISDIHYIMSLVRILSGISYILSLVRILYEIPYVIS